ncbi:hypothetical protein [Moraxella marmotae]|uniref:hypothetical protein n=1 Tax=Moraxella marmotae TaxID=3344520 RepID=UPI0035F3502B
MSIFGQLFQRQNGDKAATNFTSQNLGNQILLAIFDAFLRQKYTFWAKFGQIWVYKDPKRLKFSTAQFIGDFKFPKNQTVIDIFVIFTIYLACLRFA